MDFEALGRAAEALLHKDVLQLYRPVYVSDGRGRQRKGTPESLGALRGNLQSCSAERAQAEYGVTCRAERRLFCAPDARVQPGVLVEETDGTRWRIAAVPEKARSHVAALLEREGIRHADGGSA